MTEHKPGDYVIAAYKTGEYIAQIVEQNGSRLLVQIAAVMKHPTQGDLHNPYETEVPIFHQRRALAHREKTNVTASAITPYEGEVPDYEQSLRRALDDESNQLARTARWAQRCLLELDELRGDYFKNK